MIYRRNWLGYKKKMVSLAPGLKKKLLIIPSGITNKMLLMTLTLMKNINNKTITGSDIARKSVHCNYNNIGAIDSDISRKSYKQHKSFA